MYRGAIAAGVIAGLAVFLGGCGTLAESGGKESTSQSGGLAFLSYTATSDPTTGDAALLEGTAVDQGGCLVVKESHSGDVVYPIFASVDSRPTRVKDRDQVKFGGGGVDMLADGVVVPSACAETKGPFFYVVE